jgi:drug/metabolite transporter (DMT)-like permease
MIWLALSIGTMWLLAIVARWGEARNQDRLMMMAWNYLVAGTLSGALAWWSASPAVAPLTGALGVAAGISYALALLLWMIAIPLAGLGISTTAMRLAVAWPAAVSVLVFGERLTALQWAGIVLALGAMALLLRASGRGLRRSVSGLRRSVSGLRPSVSGLRPSVSGLRPMGRTGLLWLLALWVTSGANGALLKVFTELGDPAQRAPFLAVIFISAALLTWGVVALRRPPFRAGDLGRGVLFGAANVTGNAFLLLALREVPGAVTFPVRDAGIIALVSLTGVVLFGERPGRFGYAAIACAALAVVLMSL